MNCTPLPINVNWKKKNTVIYTVDKDISMTMVICGAIFYCITTKCNYFVSIYGVLGKWFVYNEYSNLKM